MNDTQWPRYQVFVRENEKSAYQDAGSVHAPDAELALLNARDVFARRPECIGMWVVPADAIFQLTKEQLESWQAPACNDLETLPRVKYLAFCKVKNSGSLTLVGEVEATTPECAMKIALERFTQGKKALVWWILPSGQLMASEPQDQESLYSPALEKNFRMSIDFQIVTAMRKIREGRDAQDVPGG